jgi:hypothetical protein
MAVVFSSNRSVRSRRSRFQLIIKTKARRPSPEQLAWRTSSWLNTRSSIPSAIRRKINEPGNGNGSAHIFAKPFRIDERRKSGCQDAFAGRFGKILDHCTIRTGFAEQVLTNLGGARHGQSPILFAKNGLAAASSRHSSTSLPTIRRAFNGIEIPP